MSAFFGHNIAGGGGGGHNTMNPKPIKKIVMKSSPT